MSTVSAVVNGEPVELPEGTTLATVVAEACASTKGVAVAVDREVVPRSAWARTAVATGDRIEIVAAAAGG
jgi:sulfur carrier protein